MKYTDTNAQTPTGVRTTTATPTLTGLWAGHTRAISEDSLVGERTWALK